jgi:hypothetical protein
MKAEAAQGKGISEWSAWYHMISPSTQENRNAAGAAAEETRTVIQGSAAGVVTPRYV